MPFHLLFRFALRASLAIACGPLVEAADDMRFHFEWIEMNHETLADFLSDRDNAAASGTRVALDPLIEQGKAAVVRTMMARARSGQRAKAESIDELIYSDQFTVPQASDDGKLIARSVPDATITRNIGTTVEIDPVRAGGDKVDLHLAAEIVSHIGDRTWGKDVAEVEVPDFYRMSAVTQLRLKNGQPRLAGTFRPDKSLQPQGERTDASRLLLFVTARLSPDGEEEIVYPNRDNFAIRYEFFETDLATFNAWVVEEEIPVEGPDLRERFLEATGKGEAVHFDTAIVSGSPGRVSFSSVREVLYPSEYEEPEADRLVPALPVAFERWDAGLEIEFDAEWLPNGALSIIPDQRTQRGRSLSNHSLRLSREVGEMRWMKNEAEVVFPRFHVMRLTQPIHFHPGKVIMLGTLRPHQATRDTKGNPIIAVFARATRLGQ